MENSIVPGGMCAAHYSWPSAPASSGEQRGFYNLDAFLTVDEAPTASQYFWAHQFWFGEGNGGYMGLQTGGVIQGVNRGKIAIFSIWDAIDAKADSPSFAERFSGEGTGWSCKVPFDWRSGTQYRLRLWELADARKPNEHEWWGCQVMDTQTDKEEFIGRILVPAPWRWLKSSTNWFVEYFGRTSRWDAVPYSKATFSSPEMDSGSIRPDSLRLETYGTCGHRAKMTNTECLACVAETGVST